MPFKLISMLDDMYACDTIIRMQLTDEQKDILKELKTIDPDQNYRGIPDVSHLSSNIAEEQPPKETSFDMFFEVDYDPEHSVLRDKLMSYRKKSQQIYRVGQLLKDYETKFLELMEDKDRLVQLLKSMKGSTSEIVDKQKKMINLSMKMKECLDYYSYHSKYNFDYPCEISCRQMYQNILQQTLSELTDGIQFFQQNTTYSQNKKYLNQFQSSRSKMLSFVKSFFIKLFNKQSNFMNKHIKINFNNQFESLYPKSKIKFVSTFMVFFPQFANNLGHILKSIKERGQEEEVKFLEMKENQIYQFQLNNSNHSLIGYLQNYMPDIYEEAIHHFFTYYRTNFHQLYLKNAPKREGNLPDVFKEKYLQCIYLLSTQYAYMCFCCRANTFEKGELIRNNIVNLAKLYFQDLTRMIKDFRNKNSFELCDIIMKLKQDYPIFLERHMSEQYQSYAFGCVSKYINDPQHIQFLISLFNSYSNKFLSELEVLCFNMLPKFQIKNTKQQVQNSIKELLLSIPKLKLCQQYAEKFLIAALDSIVKGIKEVNTRIQSRFECYLWNLEMFSTIRSGLRNVRGSLIRKQLKLQVNPSSNLFEKMKGVDRSESILKYAQDIFNVLKTGMPVINELTLDFTKYINEHCEALENQFVKDILYIYAKNMIEFLHKLTEAESKGEQTAKQTCQSVNVKSLYSSYVLSVEKYIKDAGILLKERDGYKFSDQNTKFILELLDMVYDKLFDFMDKFYVKVSSYVNETQSFKEIQALKKNYPKEW